MADRSPLIDAKMATKQGHRVLCLFDSRKATLIVNFIALALLILNFVFGALNTPLDVKSKPDIFIIVVFAISVLFYGVVIIGACSFRQCAVFTAGIWEIIAFVLNIIWIATYNWNTLTDTDRKSAIITVTVLLVWRLLCIYADFTFVHEVRKGIMTRETRAREAYFCCCNV
jgi:hypothetical protein